jgi:ferric-dicitrate binding protein FerR (iron transport regulator)
MHNRFWYLLSKKLGGEASDTELSELDELLVTNPEWMPVANDLDVYWHTSSHVHFSEGSFASHLRRMELQGQDIRVFREYIEIEETPVSFIKSPKNAWRWKAAIAAGIIGILLTLALLYYRNSSAQLGENTPATVKEVVTHRGNRSKVVLPDGTQVWLNADSKLEYKSNFGKSNREVNLSGEAYFDVVKNEQLPFLIHTKKIKIKVTGTAFNVKAYPGEALSETSLIRGRVEVTVTGRPDEKYVLKPNEKIVIRDEAIEIGKKDAHSSPEKKQQSLPLIELGYVNYIENDSLAVETSWLYNRLIFEDESFEEIARKMERWYGVEIDLLDSKVAATRFTYQIKDETITEALQNMQYAARFHFDIINDHITITR